MAGEGTKKCEIWAPPFRAQPQRGPPEGAPLSSQTHPQFGPNRSCLIRLKIIGQMRSNKVGQVRFGQMRSRPSGGRGGGGGGRGVFFLPHKPVNALCTSEKRITQSLQTDGLRSVSTLHNMEARSTNARPIAHQCNDARNFKLAFLHLGKMTQLVLLFLDVNWFAALSPPPQHFRGDSGPASLGPSVWGEGSPIRTRGYKRCPNAVAETDFGQSVFGHLVWDKPIWAITSPIFNPFLCVMVGPRRVEPERWAQDFAFFFVLPPQLFFPFLVVFSSEVRVWSSRADV